MARPDPSNPGRLLDPATIKDVERLLLKSERITKHKEYIIMGSLSILPLSRYATIPERMLLSADLDFCPALDPERGVEIREQLGMDSEFREKGGLYADYARPSWASLPDGYEDRYETVHFGHGIIGRFLDPNDCATSKLVRGEKRDIDWIVSGVQADILSTSVISFRLGTVHNFVNQEEHDRAKLLLSFISHYAAHGGVEPPPTRNSTDELGFSDVLPISKHWIDWMEARDADSHFGNNNESPTRRKPSNP